jgi:transcriptional antiterminator RfaH
MSKEWFVLKFKPNSHSQAKRNLNQQGFETFLPLYESTSRKASRFINTTRPLLPGYMFVKFDRTKLEWHKINNTYGVSRLVTFNSILKSIPTEIVNNLIARCDFADKLLPQKNKLKDGDQVKVLSGPLASFIATVETYETDQRIWILLNLMNRKTRVQTTKGNLKFLS